MRDGFYHRKLRCKIDLLVHTTNKVRLPVLTLSLLWQQAQARINRVLYFIYKLFLEPVLESTGFVKQL